MIILYIWLKNKGENVAVREMRKHAAWYMKGLRGAARLREMVNRAKSQEEIKILLKQLAGQAELMIIPADNK